ncbi:amidophosphoribosyltransferase [Bacteroidia bacterium]|nr:amidophosphoribosyltransferase [Bacteroidia bacterium]
MEEEAFLCLSCFQKLPKTNYHHCADNPAFDRFLGKVPVCKATAYLYYNKGGLGQKLVEKIKYRGNIYLGKWLGAYLAGDMLSSGFFDDVDYLIPVPLHPHKQRQRGFNQSEVIAQGIASVTGIPVKTNILYRRKANVSQTRKGVYERWKNTEGIFDVKNSDLLPNKHVLLIDDVLTTGATLEACMQPVLKEKKVQISVLTLAIT